MRLTCPECDARYEVDAALIPPEGRAVECARCGHGWRQPGPAPEPIRLRDSDLAPRIEADPPPPSMPSARPSAAVLEILREEAERELAQRAAARAKAGDKGADDAAARGADGPAEDRAARPASDVPAGHPRADAARPEGDSIPAATPPRRARSDQPELIVAELVEDHELPGAYPAEGEGAFAAEGFGPRRPDAPGQGPLPQDASGDASHWSPPARPMPHLHPAPPVARDDGYRAGFGLAVVLGVVLAGAYLVAPPLAGQGRIGAGLSEYRLSADRGRLWLHDHTLGLFSRE